MQTLMIETQRHRRDQVRRALAVACFLAPALFALACTETRRGLGEECLKGEDCLSGLCVAQECASAPPLLQGTPTVGADGSVEGSTTSDASDASEVADTSADTATSDAGDDAAD